MVVAEGCGDTLLESSGEVDGGLADFELANTEDFELGLSFNGLV